MDKLLQKYTIEEVSKKTHISPIILEKLLNKQFEKIERVKLKGFIHILETEYPDIDFSEIKIEINEFMQSKKETPKEVNIKEETTSNIKLYILVVLLIVGIISLVYYMMNKQHKIKVVENNSTITEKNYTKILPVVKEIETNISKKTAIVENNETLNKTDNTIKPIEPKIEQNLTLAIIPLEKVWFRVTYLDEGKNKEYLTSHEVDINGSGRVFIKFGHGYVKLKYNNQILEPKTKKITRVIIEDHNMSITTKKVKEFQ